MLEAAGVGKGGVGEEGIMEGGGKGAFFFPTTRPPHLNLPV